MILKLPYLISVDIFLALPLHIHFPSPVPEDMKASNKIWELRIGLVRLDIGLA